MNEHPRPRCTILSLGNSIDGDLFLKMQVPLNRRVERRLLSMRDLLASCLGYKRDGPGISSARGLRFFRPTATSSASTRSSRRSTQPARLLFALKSCAGQAESFRTLSLAVSKRMSLMSPNSFLETTPSFQLAREPSSIPLSVCAPTTSRTTRNS